MVKPLMSSSGHGQSYVHNDDELREAFREAMEDGRGDVKEVIIEEFIDFDSEFTLLTVTQKTVPRSSARPLAMCRRVATTARVGCLTPFLRSRCARPSISQPR